MSLPRLAPARLAAGQLVTWEAPSGLRRRGSLVAFVPAGVPVETVHPPCASVPNSRRRYKYKRHHVDRGAPFDRYLVAVARGRADDFFTPPARTLEAQNPTAERVQLRMRGAA